MASVLRFILSQELHRGKKIVPTFEILNNTKAVANLTLNNKLNQISTLIESGIENFMTTKAEIFKKFSGSGARKTKVTQKPRTRSRYALTG